MKEGDLVAGRYRLLRRIGAGAMGTVWAARHELLGRDLALKICAVGQGDGRASRAARDLFLREVRIVGRLRHPNVVDIADAGETGRDGLYLAMELLEGESLAERIAAGPLGPSDALAVAAEVCRGLAAAHAAGVIHRDLKPENVFLARGPAGGVVPKLLDFGVSSAGGVTTLRREELFGTPAYMSPEQALGEGGIDRRTDVWALGVVLYEMLTGRLPFQAETYPALLPKIIELPYPPLPASVPAEVRTVVAGCLAKDRGDRYPTADALLEAIERALTALPTPEPASVRSGFFIETGQVTLPPSPSAPSFAAASTPPTARIGLAVAILALPLVIGVAAVASRVGSRHDAGGPTLGSGHASAAQAAPASSAQLPEPPAGVSSIGEPRPPAAASVPAPPASSAFTAKPPAPAARPAPSAGAPRRSVPAAGSRVTGVNSAGF